MNIELTREFKYISYLTLQGNVLNVIYKIQEKSYSILWLNAITMIIGALMLYVVSYLIIKRRVIN